MAATTATYPRVQTALSVVIDREVMVAKTAERPLRLELACLAELSLPPACLVPHHSILYEYLVLLPPVSYFGPGDER